MTFNNEGNCRNPDEKLQLSEHLIQDAVNIPTLNRWKTI
jgi:hypothetical protein